ncbi:UNVERIFIED_CONTAM: hypothetical protein NCL1_18727 [Trichonephila clavipes]
MKLVELFKMLLSIRDNIIRLTHPELIVSVYIKAASVVSSVKSITSTLGVSSVIIPGTVSGTTEFDGSIFIFLATGLFRSLQDARNKVVELAKVKFSHHSVWISVFRFSGNALPCSLLAASDSYVSFSLPLFFFDLLRFLVFRHLKNKNDKFLEKRERMIYIFK